MTSMRLLAETSPSWGAIFGIIALASGVPTTLLAWLHLRINKISEDNAQEHQKLHDRISKVKDDSMESIQNQAKVMDQEYARKGEMGVRLDAIAAMISGLTARVSDFVTLTQRVLDRQASLEEKQSPASGGPL